MNKLKSYSGFTLIELLVVISIISLLSTVVISSTQQAREKAQISKFAQEMSQVQKAIELYKSNKGEYPAVLDSTGIDLSSLISTYLLPEKIFSQNISTPSFILTSGFSVFKNVKYYYNYGITSFYTGFFNCGGPNLPQHNYVITFFSNKTLPFKRVYYENDGNGGIDPYVYQGYSGYCISD